MPVVQKPSVLEYAPVSPSTTSDSKISNHRSGASCIKISMILVCSLLAVGIILAIALLASPGSLAYVLVAGILALHAVLALALGLWISSSTKHALLSENSGTELITTKKQQ